MQLVQISGVTSWATGIPAFTSVAPLVVLATDTDPA